MQRKENQEELKVSGVSIRKQSDNLKKKTLEILYFKVSVPLAIFMSSAVRIRAMSVELKWTVLSSATGRSIRSNLCEEASQPVRTLRSGGGGCMWNLQVKRGKGSELVAGKENWEKGKRGRV